VSASNQAAALGEMNAVIEAVRRFQKDTAKLPSERRLAELLDVKRHQLRKALNVLRKSGALETPARKPKTSATQPQYNEDLVRMTNPLEVLELRFIMEPGLARLASLRASAPEVAKTTPKGTLSGPADFAFHIAVATASRNYLAAEFYKMLRQVGVDARVRIARPATPTCPKEIALRDAEHKLIADAIARRDPEAAESSMRAHLFAVQKRIHERSNANAFAA
jgi:GntR family transcriptional repressor for pyruvate dehydrogenase complex